ncbi:MAG: nucleotide exchange factor GrpE [Rickettsiaceae bacterium]|nr:nucleotide exchange factor GrpE [Rickettsiaceae bacterium]
MIEQRNTNSASKKNSLEDDIKEKKQPNEKEVANAPEIKETTQGSEVDAEDIDINEIVDNLTEQIEVLQDKLLRSMAEVENTRNRYSKMIDDARDHSINSFAKDLIPVADNMSRALEHIPQDLNSEMKNIVEGIKMTQNELKHVFKKHGLESIEPQQGEKFDYNIHHAISQIVTDQYKEGTIVNTMQTGYKLKNRLLRPASVTVAKK